MFPFDPLWVYIAVPAVLVSTLVLIKLRQRKMEKILATMLVSEENREVGPLEEEAEETSSVSAREMQTNLERSEETRSDGCSHYLGYLYMKKAPNETHIPTECYNCPDLLKCLYSPSVVERVYGE